MPDEMELSSRVAELEQVFEMYFRGDPVEAANGAINGAIDVFNAWVGEHNAVVAAENESLNRDLEAIQALDAQIDEDRHRLDREQPQPTAGAGIIEAYNARVRAFNELVARRQEQVNAFNEKNRAFKEQATAHEAEYERRKRELDARNRESRECRDRYIQWRKNDGPENFGRNVNKLYARALALSRGVGEPPPVLRSNLDRLRALRRGLAEYARKEQAEAENGFLLVEARLNGGEDCLMMVDNGASVSALTPEMAEILNIPPGEPVELNLANGITIQAPRLSIPKIQVGGAEAEFVKGVMIKEPMPGVDGSLGLSFLCQFDFKIEKGRLLLDRLGVEEAEDGAAPECEAFIAHRAEDAREARLVFEALADAGIEAFCSEISVPRGRAAERQKKSERALVNARHLVVIAGSPESAKDAWLAAEWERFARMIDAGKKEAGGLIPVLGGKVALQDLPPALARNAPVWLSNGEWAQNLARRIRATRAERHVFISHSEKDSELAELVRGILERRKIFCWMAPLDVPPGANWVKEIIKAIEGTQATVLLLTENSNDSQYVHNEINHAFKMKKSIFMLRRSEIKPNDELILFLNSAQWVNLFPPPEKDRIEALAVEISNRISRRKAMARAAQST